MFAETNLHSLINRVAGERRIALGKLVRESLLAASDGLFQVHSEPALPPDWRERLRHLAAIAEAQRDWGWWHKPPWTWLKFLLVKEADYLSWLDRATNYEAVSNEPEDEPKLRQASEQIIDRTISAQYDRAEREGGKPPNVKEIAKQVQVTLRSKGFRATQRQIQTLADADKHKKRRRPPGRTTAADNRR